MKALRTAIIALALVLPAAPAHAALIGLLGGNYDPPPITDPSIFLLEACTTQTNDLPDEYFCTFYEFADVNGDESLDPVSSIDFRVLDALGNFISVDSNVLFTDEANSQLTAPLVASPLFADGFTFRLSGAFFGEFESFETIFPFGCSEGEFLCQLAFFVGPDENHPLIQGFSAAVVGVNGIANPGATAVPEPGTLLLLGPAAAALLMRGARTGRRRNQRTE